MSVNNIVNCYDMAAGVSTLGRLLGIDVNPKKMSAFGYLNTVWLVGVGPCNNPFYPKTNSGFPIAGDDEVLPDREFFHQHSFVQFGNTVFDACIGPVQGLDFNAYFSFSIDESTDDEESVSGRNTLVVPKIVTDIY